MMRRVGELEQGDDLRLMSEEKERIGQQGEANTYFVFVREARALAGL